MGPVRQVLVLGQGLLQQEGRESSWRKRDWPGPGSGGGEGELQAGAAPWVGEGAGTQETCFLSRELPGRGITYFAGG